MSSDSYLLDTHALIFWQQKTNISKDLTKLLDDGLEDGCVFVSSVSFWEVALLEKKGRLTIGDVKQWMSEVLAASGIVLLPPTAEQMVDSVTLKEIHKDPFDRLLITQASSNNLVLVTKDEAIREYEIQTLW